MSVSQSPERSTHGHDLHSAVKVRPKRRLRSPWMYPAPCRRFVLFSVVDEWGKVGSSAHPSLLSTAGQLCLINTVIWGGRTENRGLFDDPNRIFPTTPMQQSLVQKLTNTSRYTPIKADHFIAVESLEHIIYFLMNHFCPSTLPKHTLFRLFPQFLRHGSKICRSIDHFCTLCNNN